MKSQGLAWFVDVCWWNAVSSVARGFSYLTFLFDCLLLRCSADGWYMVLEVQIGASLASLLPLIFSAPLTLIVASVWAIATFTRVVTQLLTIKALDSAWTLLLTLSELRTTARRAWLCTECPAFAWATSFATKNIVIACHRLFSVTGRETTEGTAWPPTSEAEAGHCTRCRRKRGVVACDPYNKLWKRCKLRRFGKGFNDYKDDACTQHLVVQVVDKQLD